MLNTYKSIEINSRLREIFKSRFGINFTGMGEEALNQELLGRTIKLKARDLLYVFFDIEKEFGIVIPEEEVAEGRFNTFNNIVGIISSQLLRKTG